MPIDKVDSQLQEFKWYEHYIQKIKYYSYQRKTVADTMEDEKPHKSASFLRRNSRYSTWVIYKYFISFMQVLFQFISMSTVVLLYIIFCLCSISFSHFLAHCQEPQLSKEMFKCPGNYSQANE